MKISYLCNSSYVGCVVIIGSHMIDQDWDGQVGVISHITLSRKITSQMVFPLVTGLFFNAIWLVVKRVFTMLRTNCQESSGLGHQPLDVGHANVTEGLSFRDDVFVLSSVPNIQELWLDWNVHFGDTNNLWTYHDMVNQDTWRGSKLIKFNFSAQIPKKRQHWKLVYKKPLYM